jgi:mono/diheme cytochrome c family protein
MKSRNKTLMQLNRSMLIVAAMVIGLVAYSSPHDGTTLATGQERNWNVPAEAKKMKNPLAGDSQALERGRELYKIRCVMCHGDKGKGDGLVADSLNPKPTDLSKTATEQTDGELFWKITNGRLPMPAFEVTLNEEDRWALVTFINSGL